jgi:hypothetical protein
MTKLVKITINVEIDVEGQEPDTHEDSLQLFVTDDATEAAILKDVMNLVEQLESM